MDEKSYNKLSPEEERVIIHKGTEPPFSGEYNDFFAKGTYQCKQCSAPLYSSNDKFESSCGWPSFDDEIKGAIKKETDADGSRTEILCANCGGHLGHVFEGERLTDKNVRHCVNSVAMLFVSDKESELAKAHFAGGCFWGVEYNFSKIKGVNSVVSGYSGGKTENPTYEQVCSNSTEHAEVVLIDYNSDIVSYDSLLNVFWEKHDPTTLNRQGPDVGTQYRSAIYYFTEMQKAIAKKSLDYLQSKIGDKKIVTEITEAGDFWIAEEYHQKYFEKHRINH